MSRYTFLVNILDELRREAVQHKHAARYEGSASIEALNQARARAFIHLYLKVNFGILSFSDREHFVTDGSLDGGIDGYFIANDTKTIYFIQSKFRTTQQNFENKEIDLDEIIVMDIDRITAGETHDEKGNQYNGKIFQLEREISQIPDIARWKYTVVLLANLTGISPGRLSRLVGNFPVEVIDSEKCYSSLVFPVISGTFFGASELKIHLDLSNKSAGTKISYTVSTEHSDCEITVVFVPILEIAKTLQQYKNSILRFNPRSYLELDGKKVNQAIRNTVLNTPTNEFALFNNGITMMSEVTDINERIGQKNKAQLTLTNPQIVNGGQTAYTLSRIYEETLESDRQVVFGNKEVLLKVITLIDREDVPATLSQKTELIDRISSATNQQTTVINADKFSNDQVYLRIQHIVFERYGLLFERKRGEFADGLHKNYVQAEQIVERNLFFRIFLAVRGNLTGSIQKKLFMNFEYPEKTVEDLALLDRVAFGFSLFKALIGEAKRSQPDKNVQFFAKLYVLANRQIPITHDEYDRIAKEYVDGFDQEWRQFFSAAAVSKKAFWRKTIDPKTSQATTSFSVDKWTSSPGFGADVRVAFEVPHYADPDKPYLPVAPVYDPERLSARKERRERKRDLIPVGTDAPVPPETGEGNTS